MPLAHVADRLRLVYLQLAALPGRLAPAGMPRCPVTSIRGAVETGRFSGNPSALVSILFCSKLAQPLNGLFFAAKAGDRTVLARTAHLINPVPMATGMTAKSIILTQPTTRSGATPPQFSFHQVASSYPLKALSAQLKSQPRIEKDRVVAAGVAPKPVIVLSAAIKHSVKGILQTDLQVTNGLAQQVLLAEGYPVGSKMNALLLGFPFALPVIGAGGNSRGLAVPQVYCQPTLTP